MNGLIERAAKVADVIEVRFDCLEAIARITRPRDFAGTILATYRPQNGGQGGTRELSETEREAFWANPEISEFADWCDLEIDLRPSPAGFKNIIRSFHFFESVPSADEIESTFRTILDAGCDVVKIAVRTDDVTDTIPIWKLLERPSSKPLVPIAMGEAGKWTRILGPAHGAFMTYAALDSGRETAPGQISATDLRDVYRIKELDVNTDVYGILGGDTSYSLSPFIHNAAFGSKRSNAVFVPLQVSDLDAFIRRMVRREAREVELNFKGFAVTIPHKVSIIRHLDEIDETARAIGAVNTVKVVGDKLIGFNTDADGFVQPLKKAYGDLKNARIAVFGAGGAARACVYALSREGAKVSIFTRDEQKATRFADEFGIQAGAGSARFDIVVNATPLGTTGRHETESAVSDAILKDARLAYDLVYNPFETRLLREAKAIGVKAVGGFEMLIAQAIRQQIIWTGIEPSEEAMRSAALKRLRI
ncbi:MAG: shikimate dehydrogenase [Acidobacteria bacterium]|nr:shikimate dehydrogenase [Acidobacteriota bacterium]